MSKEFSEIGCCGIDCSLCPRFHTNGDSRCPGCGGENFKDKHPSCGCLTCCSTKKGFEVCAGCPDFPCERLTSDKSRQDSFVTHKVMLTNLQSIKERGISSFINQQSIRNSILNEFLSVYDDGRTKSFFCISCTLLPLELLQEAKAEIEQEKDLSDIKTRCKRLKSILQEKAKTLDIELRLNKKTE